MANKVITVTDPSIVTNDTLVGYNNYSDQDGQLGTTMTPTEATNGKTITLSDGVVHEVTTKPVGATNGEFSAVVSDAVTVDLTLGYGLDANEANITDIEGFGVIGQNDDFSINFTVGSSPTVIGGYFWSNRRAGSLANSISVESRGTDLFLSVTDVGDIVTETADFPFVVGDVVRVSKVADDITLYINDELKETIAVDPSWNWITTAICIGSYQTGRVGEILGAKISQFSITASGVTEDVLPVVSNTSNPFLGSQGNEYTIATVNGTDPLDDLYAL